MISPKHEDAGWFSPVGPRNNFPFIVSVGVCVCGGGGSFQLQNTAGGGVEGSVKVWWAMLQRRRRLLVYSGRFSLDSLARTTSMEGRVKP